MTKDVLVRVKGTRLMGEEDETIEFITAGTWYEKNGKQYLIYEEAIADTGEMTRNTVIIGTDRLEVMKRGLVKTHMIFECGKKNMASYVTPVGLIMLGITTSSMEIEESETKIRIAVSYSLEMNGEYVSGCRLELSAGPKEEGALRLQSDTKDI